jgi:hypothetical protein
MKLTELQLDRLRRSYQEASQVLREVKQKPLKGQALQDMKTLEGAVQSLEVLLLK